RTHRLDAGLSRRDGRAPPVPYGCGRVRQFVFVGQHHHRRAWTVHHGRSVDRRTVVFSGPVAAVGATTGRGRAIVRTLVVDGSRIHRRLGSRRRRNAHPPSPLGRTTVAVPGRGHRPLARPQRSAGRRNPHRRPRQGRHAGRARHGNLR